MFIIYSYGHENCGSRACACAPYGGGHIPAIAMIAGTHASTFSLMSRSPYLNLNLTMIARTQIALMALMINGTSSSPSAGGAGGLRREVPESGTDSVQSPPPLPRTAAMLGARHLISIYYMG